MNLKTFIFVLTASVLIMTSCKVPSEKSALPEELNASVLHPDFSLTFPDLEALIDDQPEEIRRKILERPQYFLELTAKLLDKSEEILFLVNKETGLTPQDNPEDLRELDDYSRILTLSRQGHKLRGIVLPQLLAMNEAAKQEGLSLLISSTYRSYEYQKMLFNRYVERDGLEEAERYSARPGHSQHQLGTVIDFGSIDETFAETPEGKWLYTNAWKYGFSLTYPKGLEDLTGYMWESWHYRYITPAGTEMEREFFLGIQEYLLRFFHQKKTFLMEKRID